MCSFVLLRQFLGNVLAEKKRCIRGITSKSLYFFETVSVTLEYFDVVISVTSCAVLSQQKEQKVCSNKAVFPFGYSKRYIEIL